MRLSETYPLLNFKETSAKDMFLRRLKGLPINFGHINMKDKFKFIDFAVEHNLLKFVRYVEYRGILGQYDILENFSFNIDREDVMNGRRWLRLHKRDCLEFSEQLLGRNRRRNDDSIIYQIYTYVSDKKRKEIYGI